MSVGKHERLRLHLGRLVPSIQRHRMTLIAGKQAIVVQHRTKMRKSPAQLNKDDLSHLLKVDAHSTHVGRGGACQAGWS
jgi:hypothetical protein